MSNHGSTIRRRTLRVALIGGAFALVSSLGVGHAFAVGPWPGDWTGPFPSGFNGPFPAHFNGPFPNNASDSSAPADDWANANPASSADDSAWSVDVPATHDDWAPAGGDDKKS
jgi:hypothetical protein